MNEKWMRPVELLEIFLNFLTVFCVETALFSAFEPLGSALGEEGALGEGAAAGYAAFSAPSAAVQFLLLTVPVCFWLVRIFASRFWLFILLHAVIFGAAVFGLGANDLQQAIFGVISGIYLIVSLRSRLQEQREEEGLMGPAAALTAALAAIFLCAYLGDGAACGRILNASLAYAFFFFLDTYLRNLQRFVQFNRASNAHIPVRRMLAQGGGLAAGSSLLAVLLLALGVNQSFMDRAGELLKGFLLWAVKGILRLIGAVLSLFGSEGGEQEAVGQEAAVGQLMLAEAKEQPVWLEILYQVIQYLLLGAAFLLLCFLLYKAVSALVRRFYEGKKERQPEGEKTQEIRESLRTERRKKDRKGSLGLFGRTPEEKIRRSFIRAVQKQKRFRNPDGRPGGAKGKDLWRKDARENLVRGKTARELAFLFPDQGQETFARLARLYEKARYGGADAAGREKAACGAEDVRQAEACRETLSGKQI